MQDTTSRTELQSFWHCHVERYLASELSKAAYCREHDLSYHQMVYWSSKAQRPDSRSLATVSSSSPMLVPVSLAPSSSGDLSIRLPTGVVISGINASTVGLLGAVIGSL